MKAPILILILSWTFPAFAQVIPPNVSVTVSDFEGSTRDIKSEGDQQRLMEFLRQDSCIARNLNTVLDQLANWSEYDAFLKKQGREMGSRKDLVIHVLLMDKRKWSPNNKMQIYVYAHANNRNRSQAKHLDILNEKGKECYSNLELAAKLNDEMTGRQFAENVVRISFPDAKVVQKEPVVNSLVYVAERLKKPTEGETPVQSAMTHY